MKKILCLLVPCLVLCGHVLAADKEHKEVSPYSKDLDARNEKAVKEALVRGESPMHGNQSYYLTPEQEKEKIKAAKAGDVQAAVSLYGFYQFVSTDRYPEILYWTTAAAQGGDAASQYNLGSFYEHGLSHNDHLANPELALYWYRKAAEQGHKLAAEQIQQLSRDQK